MADTTTASSDFAATPCVLCDGGTGDPVPEGHDLCGKCDLFLEAELAAAERNREAAGPPRE